MRIRNWAGALALVAMVLMTGCSGTADVFSTPPPGSGQGPETPSTPASDSMGSSAGSDSFAAR